MKLTDRPLKGSETLFYYSDHSTSPHIWSHCNKNSKKITMVWVAKA